MEYPTGCRPKGERIEIRWGTEPNRFSEYLEISPNEEGFRRAAKIRRSRIQEQKYGPKNPSKRGHHSQTEFGEVAQRWLELTYKDKKWSKATYHGHRNNLNRYWMPRFAADPITSITFEEIESRWESFVFNTAKTAANVLTPFKGIFRFAYSKNIIAEDLAARIKVTPDQAPEIYPFTYDEKELIIKALGEIADKDPNERIWQVYWATLFDTGIRTPSESSALTWQDWNGQRFRVKDAIVRREAAGRTKTKKPRNVVASLRVRKMLETWPDSRHHRFRRGPIFVNTFGTTLLDGDLQNDRFYAACDRAGVTRRRPYNTRHTFATLGVMAGKKPGLLAKHLGHTLETFYRRYQDWIESEEDEAEILDIEAHYEKLKDDDNDNIKGDTEK